MSRSALPLHDDVGGAGARWLLYAGALFLIPVLISRLASAAVTTDKTADTTPTDSATANPAANSAADSADANSAEEAATAMATFDPNNIEKLLLDVKINGYSTGKIGEFTLRNGKLLARAQELHDLGLRLPAALLSTPNLLVALSDLPGVTYSIDQKKQILLITASDSALLPTLLLPEGIGEANGHREIESGTGLTLNYDIAGTYASGQTSATGSFDMRAFTPKGILSSDWLAYGGAVTSPSGANKATRLDSAYTYADVNSLRRHSLGDYITSGLSWTRPVHMEGAQIRSDFTTRPDLITFPLPSVSGSAAVPSTVAILTNGNQTVSSEVAAGPFEIPELPVISGAGTITVSVTNALGQQVSVSKPFYASSTLLKPGLQTYAAQAGLVRRNWGAFSNDYGKMAGTAIYRRGLTRFFTVEGSVEGTPGATAGGAGGITQIGNLGVVNFAAAASTGSAGGTGAQYCMGAQRIGRIFSVGASAIVANRYYQDVAAINGAGVPRKQISAFTGLASKRFGSIGAAYAGLDQDASSVTIPPALTPEPAVHSHVVSANYSRQINRLSIYTTYFKDHVNPGSSSGLQASVTIALGRRNTVSASGSSNNSSGSTEYIGQAQVQQSAPQIYDWGYLASVSAGSGNHEFAQGQYKSRVGLFTAGVDEDEGATTVRAESMAAISFVDKHLFPSNWIYDSFAIVDTGSVPHVHVLQENRPVGSTNSSGKLLVPDMRSFEQNQIRIDANDIPPDAALTTDARVIRPQDRSGVVVKYPVKFNRAALLQLVDAAGAAIPLGSTATLKATGIVFPIGYDGDVYVEGLDSHNELTVESADGRHCTLAFNYTPLPGDIPSIGPLLCQEKKP
ncbi:MAG: fimbria/pilus outer membrane usher protein [Terracidiphilus sp.]